MNKVILVHSEAHLAPGTERARRGAESVYVLKVHVPFCPSWCRG